MTHTRRTLISYSLPASQLPQKSTTFPANQKSSYYRDYFLLRYALNQAYSSGKIEELCVGGGFAAGCKAPTYT